MTYVYTTETITILKTMNIFISFKFPPAPLWSLPIPRQPLVVCHRKLVCYVKENHTVCIVSLCIILIFFQLMNSIPICRCTTVSSIDHLLKQIWVVSSFLLLQNKTAINNHVFIDLYKDCAFISPVYIPRNGMTRSYGRCMFNLLISRQAVCPSLHFPDWFTFSAAVGIPVPLYRC